jgi:hypothetical protein
MMFPYPITQLTPLLRKNYEDRFSNSSGWDRSIRENVWRRHQDEKNQSLSDWQPGQHRRRLIHFRDRYGLWGDYFSLIEAYIFLQIKAPKNEVEEYKSRIVKYWKKDESNLTLTMQECGVHQADIEADRITPCDYANLDVWVTNTKQPESVLNKPWRILKTGIRPRVPRGNPKYITQSELKDFFPAQLELGCGPSIEAGVPPLNFFHKLFSLHRDGKFVMKAKEDTFLEFFKNPSVWYQQASAMHRLCLLASPTRFYHNTKRLHDEGHIVGPIFNNNFDGLPISAELEEYSLRQHDEIGEYPAYNFHPKAKSLIVVGSHADRRRCQEHARAKGMRIVFIDPEGYDQDGQFVPYPIESPQDQDCVLKCRASELDYKLMF